MPDTIDERTSRGIDVALAEFAALRSEIVATQSVHSSISIAGLTVGGVIGGLSLQIAQDSLLVYLLPVVMLFISISQQTQTQRIVRLGDYIREELWPYLNRETDYKSSWESYYSSREKWRSNSLIVHVVFDGSFPILLGAIGALAMVSGPGLEWPFAILGWICVALTLLIPAASQLWIKRRVAIPDSIPAPAAEVQSSQSAADAPTGGKSEKH